MSRYINADVFMKNLKTNEHGDTDVNQVEIAIDKSRADVVEVRHGRWLDRTQEPGWPVAECSVCGSHAGMFWMNYCPHCGARMDGGIDE